MGQDNSVDNLVESNTIIADYYKLSWYSVVEGEVICFIYYLKY